MNGTFATLERLLNPPSLAVVGATEKSYWVRSLLSNLREQGYPGKIFLVNPHYQQQFGLPCYPSLRDVPASVDSAFIMTPAGQVESVLRECGERGISSVTVLAAGFRETGPVGQRREDQLVQICRAYGITMQGPNCLGFINFSKRIAACALPVTPPIISGSIGIVSQSGAMMRYIQRYATKRNIGMSFLISVGNGAMVDAVDFLDFLVDHSLTQVIGLLMETIPDPHRFQRAARRCLEAGKPLVVLKIGRTPAGARAAQAHTGALAGPWRIMSAVFRQWGIVTVESIEELMETAALLANSGYPSGRRMAVVAFSGGACGILSDLANAYQLEIPDLRTGTKSALATFLPSFATPQNPLDVTGQVVADSSLLARAVATVAGDPGVDGVIIVADPPEEPGPMSQGRETQLRELASTLRGLDTFSFFVSGHTGEITPYGRAFLDRHGLHFGNGLPLSIQALGNAVRYGDFRRRARQKEGGPVTQPVPVLPEFKAGDVLTEWESKRLLAAYGIPVPAERLVTREEDCVKAAQEIGFPVVLKIQSPDIPHKTEVGGVRTGLRTEGEVIRAYQELMAEVGRRAPTARVHGVLVAPYFEPVGELLAGVVWDPHWGPVVLVGSGGIWAEVADDVAMRQPPIHRDDAAEMIRELRIYPVLRGLRGRPPGDLAKVADCLVRLGQLALDLQGRFKELDINPLFVMPEGQGVVAADALVVCIPVHETR